jgi:hypothetical protein
MRNKKFSIHALSLALVVLCFGSTAAYAQPTDAQLKKQLTSAKTVSVTLGGPGKIEWSTTYKKYMWTRSFTARLKTDTPGEILIVKGYAAYDVMGGRYVYWRTFTSSNNYEGKKNPTIAEINEVLAKEEPGEFNFNNSVVGEYESFKIAPDANWEWHTPNSVSFNAVGVLWLDAGGKRYDGEAWYTPPAGFRALDKVESYLRLRLYRDAPNLPWRTVGASVNIPISARSITQKIRLLERKDYPEAEVKRMARMSKVPLLTQ